MREQAIDWPRIRLVAFDVDGTLYAQRPVRLRMAARIALHCLVRADPAVLFVLRTFRNHRETLAEAEAVRFEDVLVAHVVRRHGLAGDEVRRIASEWLDERPLSLLGRHRYPGIDRLFQRIRRSGRLIGVLSDYPAEAKLAAMELEADHVVCAGDVGVLKPHPLGLERLMEMAGVGKDETLLIGDRAERDGEAARRAGAACLLRSRKPVEGWPTFARFDDPVFDGIESAPAGTFA